VLSLRGFHGHADAASLLKLKLLGDFSAAALLGRQERGKAALFITTLAALAASSPQPGRAQVPAPAPRSSYLYLTKLGYGTTK
jgi:hypothetical protein